jgi:hypothetical protein
MIEGLPIVVVVGVVIVFALVIGTFIFNAGRGISEWSSNNNQPVLIVQAKVVTKRTNVSVHHHHHANHTHDSTSTQYFATFELERGERREFQISGREFGLLAEGDAGELTYQGTRYKGFNRRL